MIFEEYESTWEKIRKKEKKLIELINKREELFDKTQPQGTKYDKELVDGKNPKNIIEEYIIQKEYMNEKINQLNTTLDDMYQILKRKREELKLSRNLYDRIYYLNYIEKLNIQKIANMIGYDRTSIWRHLKRIEKITTCNKMQH